MNTKQKINNIRTDERAISPIIGTILMVAITVIMAAIIANWSSGIKAPEAPTSVGLDIARQNQTDIQVTVTSIDPPATLMTKLSFTNKTGGAQSLFNPTGILIGNSTTFKVSDTNEFVVIVATYGDGTSKTIYSQKV
jgi:flagellin-like protein